MILITLMFDGSMFKYKTRVNVLMTTRKIFFFKIEKFRVFIEFLILISFALVKEDILCINLMTDLSLCRSQCLEQLWEWLSVKMEI